MFRPYPLYLGLRYVGARRRNHFISFISVSSMAGVALGVAALITVISVMNGFETELRQRILGVIAHATITGPGDKLLEWQPVTKAAMDHPNVVGAAPYVQTEAMMSQRDNVSGALVRGILPELEVAVSGLNQHLLEGASLDSLQPGSYNLILGRALAMTLGVGVGDRVTIVSPRTLVTPAGILPRMKRFSVTGLFEMGMYEYDSALALVHQADAQALLRMEQGVTGVRLKLDELFAAPRVAREVAASLPGDYYFIDWTRQHGNFFQALRTEKITMFVILLLIVGVAAFNIVSTLVMVVTDKQADIAILRTLGATPRGIMLTFMVQGCLIGLIGTLIGLVGGVLLVLNIDVLVPWIEGLAGVDLLPDDVYPIADLPAELRPGDLLRITGVAFLLCLTSTIYPALRAARVQPAEALRYE
ncbi:MAG: lipoprotein-releasing ABC transporter permease subunit [Gammaproteobacteria bacterium]|nr:lipoprotein-releasing ABC transporter permease subunit [Gammaproteobacteria bacterium]